MNDLTLRRATMSDCSTLFRWVNDPIVRMSALNRKTIKWDEHLTWFAERFGSPNCHMFVVLWGEDPIGQVRIELDTNRWLLDYSLDSEYRGKGLAGKALVLAFKEVYESGIREVHAEVALENVRSLHVLLNVGFKRETTTHPELHLLSMQLPKGCNG